MKKIENDVDAATIATIETHANDSTYSDDQYIYIVHNLTPEFMPNTTSQAFRRDKHFKASDMKIIKCPHCRGVFRTVDKTAKVELYRRNVKTKEKCHNSLPCFSCHTAVGVLYAGA